MVMNESIQYPSLRVVFDNPDTNKAEWRILSRHDALQLAKSFDLDLVLVDATSIPPVCKLIDLRKRSLQRFKMKKEHTSKAKPMKEVFVSTSIDPHDLEVKMKRVRNFLQDGHQVKLSITTLKRDFEKNPQVKYFL